MVLYRENSVALIVSVCVTGGVGSSSVLFFLQPMTNMQLNTSNNNCVAFIMILFLIVI